MKNRDIEAGAKAIAGDQMLPGGRRKKLSRLVEDHLGWFDAAEARGMTWEDMIAALSAVGVTRPDGRPLSVGTLSSAVWRKRSQATLPRRAKHTAGAPRPTSANKPSPSRAVLSPSSSKKGAGGGAPPAACSGRAGHSVNEVSSQGAGVLAFMRRAAKMRRSEND